jgi:hypothetical protein
MVDSFRQNKKKSMSFWPRGRKRNDPMSTVKIIPSIPVILSRQHSTKNPKIHLHPHCISKILTIIKVVHFFIFHKMLVLIYVPIMVRNDALFPNNVFILTKVIPKVFKRFITFQCMHICFSLVQWIVKLK